MSHSVFDKLHELRETLQGEHDQPPVSAGEHKGQNEIRDEICGEAKREERIQHKEGWSDKLKDVLDGGETRRKREEEEERLRVEKEREEARVKVESERGWTGKLQDAFDGGKHKKELEEAEFQRIDQEAQVESKKHEGLSDKLRDALDNSTDELAKKVREITGSQRDKADVQEEVDQQHLSDNVKRLWHDAPAGERTEQNKNHRLREHEGKPPPGNKSGDEGWRDQLRALAGGSQKMEKRQVERSWLKEKFNNMAGGGAAGEANEDTLDKTIDYIQEYILGQGDQSNESALENFKDEQISDAIRMAYIHVTGHVLPIADK